VNQEVTILKALAEPTRLRLAVLLALNGETCVCRLAEALEAPQFRISRHLGILRDRGVVEARRDGTWMYYRLSEPRSSLETCLQGCLRECFADDATIQGDSARFVRGECGAQPPEKLPPQK
jgi:ArsR family transcriptional regulator, arsenate/arsenite/antimonite-responsive transcriptional repressor